MDASEGYLSEEIWLWGNHMQAAQILAEQLGCDLITFPGHHGSFMDMPVEWAASLRSVLHKAEEETL